MPDNGSSGSAGGRSRYLILAWAGIAGGAGVALAAVAAHAVATPALQTAATMLMIHAAAATAIAAVAPQSRCGRWWNASALLMLLGSSFFSGEIALHELAGEQPLPMLAPIGGSLMIASWLAMACVAVLSAWRCR
jgi:uncharacterized membrane protein YgdD (TMEM256/DUF423 family)